jgi:thiol-disulfide isomerase/thioredoxin
MARVLSISCLVFCVAFLASTLQAQTTAPAAGDEQAMLLAYRAMQPPQVDMSRRGDQAYVESFMKDYTAFQMKRADMAKAFHDKYPNDPAAESMMEERWMMLARLGQEATMQAETDQALAAHPTDQARAGILYVRAVAALNLDPTKAPDAIDEFIKTAPSDERGAALLFSENTDDADKHLANCRRIIQLYPQSMYATMAQGAIHQSDSIGKPFDLTFTDAIGGKQISVQKDLKGKVVVIDFWATWCGPCVGEMPANKELYAKYKDKGVEFIGVSLDQPEAQGGLKALKDFVAQNGITWPQYYQGNYWQSEFSSGWGIDAIPCVFLVDADGKLFSVTARGQLDDLIPKLIAKRDGKG